MMPAGLAMRYDLPHISLRETVSGYATYAAHDRAEMINWFFAGAAHDLRARRRWTGVHHASTAPLQRG